MRNIDGRTIWSSSIATGAAMKSERADQDVFRRLLLDSYQAAFAAGHPGVPHSFSCTSTGLKTRFQPSSELNTDMLSTSIGSCLRRRRRNICRHLSAKLSSGVFIRALAFALSCAPFTSLRNFISAALFISNSRLVPVPTLRAWASSADRLRASHDCSGIAQGRDAFAVQSRRRFLHGSSRDAQVVPERQRLMS